MTGYTTAPERDHGDGGDGEGEGGTVPFTPFLVIGTRPFDDGSRPPGGPFWASPDIAVSTADAAGHVPQGVDATIAVTVHNLGSAAAFGVRVTFFWSDPSLWLSDPSQGPTAATATPIGTGEPAPGSTGLPGTIAGHSDKTYACTTPWSPEFVNGGHECLIVVVSSTGDPLPPKHAFRADLDRHVGQRNMTVLPNDDESRSITLRLTNPFGRDAPTEVWLRTDVVAGAERLVGIDLPVAPIDCIVHAEDPALVDLLSGFGIEHGPIETGSGVLRIGDPRPGDITVDPVDPDVEEELRRTGAVGRDAGEAVAGIDLPPGATASLDVEIACGGWQGNPVVQRFTQVTDGVVLGGYTVVSLPF
jgi:hypothetical protein